MSKRTFTVPAGTVLANGFVVPDTVRITREYDKAQMTAGQAQKAAGRDALAELQARYGITSKDTKGFAGLQRSTKAVQAATPTRGRGTGEAAPRARGGRKQTAAQYTVERSKTKNGKRVVYLQITNAETVADVFQAITGLIAKGLAIKGAQSAALHATISLFISEDDGAGTLEGSGPDRLTDFQAALEAQARQSSDEGYEKEIELHGQTPAVNSSAAWRQLFPNRTALENYLGLPLERSGDYEVIVRVGRGS